MASEVYYKILITEKGLEAACLQDFDEPDYRGANFLSQTKFQTEEDARGMIQGIYAFIGRYVIST